MAAADAWTVYAVAVAAFLVALALLAVIIRRHSDAQR
jgi:hypothetical protein